MKQLKFALVLTIAVFVVISTATADSGSSHEDDESSEESSKAGGCYATKCSSYSYCTPGYQELHVDKRSCPRGQEKKICCKQIDGCVDTICEPHTPRCPSGTTEFARDMVVCNSRAPTMTSLFCCNENYFPTCFNMSCATNGGIIGQGEECPAKYHVVDGGQGEEWGCPKDSNYVYGRKTCCLSQKEEESDEENVGNKMGGNIFWIFVTLAGTMVGLMK